MPEVIIQCPQCNRQLRVPEEMIGRLVKCPTCGMTFTLASSSNQPVLHALPAEEAGSRVVRPAPAAWDAYGERVADAGNPLMIPAICLLVLGMVGLMMNVLYMASVLVQTPENIIQPDMPEEAKQVARFLVGPGGVAVFGTFCVFSLLIALGAGSMLARRFYGLAIVGSLVALVNLNCFCCVPAFPFSVWALVLLFRPEVKALFE